MVSSRWGSQASIFMARAPPMASPLQPHPLIRERRRAFPQPPYVPRQQGLQEGTTGRFRSML